MFITLLAVTFVLSLAVSLIVVGVFAKPCAKILQRLIADDLSRAWLRYLEFAIVVVGISSGVRIWELEKYIIPRQTGLLDSGTTIQLTRDRWALELYRTIIEALQGISWLLLVFFMITLIAFVIVRVFEFRRTKAESRT